MPDQSVANGGHGAQSAPLPTLRFNSSGTRRRTTAICDRSDNAEDWVLQASREVADRYRAVQCHRQVSERVGRVRGPVVHGVGLGYLELVVLARAVELQGL